ncbi:helix-turn-helix domain-containing protein [Achromobacter xylosoxidans]
MLVLRAVSRTRGEGAGLLALTRDTGMSKPTVHRILAALAAEGMVEQDLASRRYFLGPECHVLGNIASERFGINRLAAPVVARLAHECGDSAFFRCAATCSRSACCARTATTRSRPTCCCPAIAIRWASAPAAWPSWRRCPTTRSTPACRPMPA